MRRSCVALLLLAAGCPGAHTDRPYPAPTAAELVARIVKARDQLTSFRADSTMDYWVGSQRVKGEVLVMGKVGAKVRFAALSPAGGSTVVEMACDGGNFVLVDNQNNCALTGPCDAHSIAQFFHIDLTPDDFLHLALGTPPTPDNPTGTVTWDAAHGYEKVALTGGDTTEQITIDARDKRLDVIDTELDAGGKPVWTVANTDFKAVGAFRLPGKTRFQSPGDKQDLVVEWSGQRDVNLALPDNLFVLAAPPGLPICQ